MPWKETCPVDQRVQFVSEWMKGDRTMVDLCRAFGVSRKTGYKWLERYDENGPRGLVERSRRPRESPRATASDVVELIVRVKKERPTWGPRKIRDWLGRNRTELGIPASSTIGEILKRHGLVRAKRRRASASGRPPVRPFGDAHEPNDIWATDFKGWFRVGRLKCHPLTIADTVSRYSIRAEGLAHPRTLPVEKIFRSAFLEFGLPKAIRSDNGPPFASRGPGGLTRLSAWWVKLGIRVERITPGKPQENGRLERFHKTLKAETANPPQREMSKQQRAFDLFVSEYNEERPHDALEGRCPADLYERSPRRYQPEMDFRDLEYPEEFETRRASKLGRLEFEGRQVFVGRALAHELVGFRQIMPKRWHVFFGPITLGEVTIESPRRGRKGILKLSPMSPV